MFQPPNPMYTQLPQILGQRSAGGQLMQAPVINPMQGGGAQQSPNPLMSIGGLARAFGTPQQPNANPLIGGNLGQPPSSPLLGSAQNPAANNQAAAAAYTALQNQDSAADAAAPLQQAMSSGLPSANVAAGTAGAAGASAWPAWLKGLFG